MEPAFRTSFCEDGYTPSPQPPPLVLASAIAARTEHMRLGTHLILLPFPDSVRVAEDGATLSLISGGRFDLGVGIGYRRGPRGGSCARCGPRSLGNQKIL